MSPRAPDIVLIMSDQHQAAMMGCAGDETVRTPAIDSLAACGVRFSRVNCQGPLCMPSRASFMTERYVRDHGVYTNWAEIPPDSPTYVSALREAGYHTALIGKAHLYRDELASARHVDELAPRLGALGFDEVRETGDKFLPDIPNRYSDFLADRGVLDDYRAHIAARAYQGEGEKGLNATKSVPMWDSTPTPVPLDAYIDTWHGVEAASWITTYDRAAPFFLFVGFPGPHDPWDAPAAARGRSVDVSMPATTVRPSLEGAGRYGGLLSSFLWLSDSDTMTPSSVAAMRTAYAADIRIIDDAIGRIVTALSDTGRLENTWIIYTSDHGEMAGGHGLLSKCVMYAESVRVPLVVCPPGGCTPRVVDALVEHLDVPTTLRDVAGAPAIPGSEGRSLVPFFGGGSPPRREVVVSENWGFACFETGTHKLVVDEDALDPCQLFDLTEDPHEDYNLVDDPGVRPILDSLMETYVRPFLATPPARPHASIFTG